MQLLKAAREEAGLTSAELGKLVHLEASEIERLEALEPSGQVTIAELDRIGQVLGRRLRYGFDRSDRSAAGLARGLLDRESAMLRIVSLPKRLVGSAALDPQRLSLALPHEIIDLTPAEYLALHCLMGRPGMTVRNREIIEAVWADYAPAKVRSLRVILLRVRRKLARIGVDERVIQTDRRQLGYSFDAQCLPDALPG